MTRLYYDNANQTEFEARVVAREPHERGVALRLDRTLFYPISGGQPCDLGWINDIPVLDVFERGEAIIHVLERDPGQDQVRGKIDWRRRFDHMQQHTGQHLLSAVFEDHAGAKTVSFHLSQEVSTIDLADPNLDLETMDEVERRCNQIVFDDLDITAAFHAPDQASQLSLRKEPGQHEEIRVVQIAGIDAAACCGTHCQRTGQVGPIKIRKWEKRGAETRVEFLCGWRALRDYHWKHRDIMDCALALSIQDREVAETALRLAEEVKALNKQVSDLQDALLDVEAAAHVERAVPMAGAQGIKAVFENRDATQVRYLVAKITERPGLIALCGIQGPKGQLVFGCAPDVPAHMGQLIREICKRFGGGGGGHPQLAQGGGLESVDVEQAVEQAWRVLESWLNDEKGAQA